MTHIFRNKSVMGSAMSLAPVRRPSLSLGGKMKGGVQRSNSSMARTSVAGSMNPSVNPGGISKSGSVSQTGTTGSTNFLAPENDKSSPDMMAASNFLTKLQLSPALAPLLGLLIPNLKVKVPKTGVTGMDGRAVNSFLKKLVVKAVQQIAEPFMMVFDNAHWIDEFSMSVIAEVIKSCSNACILVVCRPRVDYPMAWFTKIWEAPETIRINLKGLSLQEVEEFIVWEFRASDVNDVDSKLLTGITSTYKINKKVYDAG
jgi:hypothetical protein